MPLNTLTASAGLIVGGGEIFESLNYLATKNATSIFYNPYYVIQKKMLGVPTRLDFPHIMSIPSTPSGENGGLYTGVILRFILGMNSEAFAWFFCKKLRNRDDFILYYPGATGIKNGWTPAAGYTLVASAFQGDTELIVVLLGAYTRDLVYETAYRLMDQGFHLEQNAWKLQSAKG